MKRRKEENGFEKWGGYMNAKIAKLEEQFLEDAATKKKQSDIFKGVCIFVNGYTEPSSEELRRIMLNHGGIFHDYEVDTTTHVIASNLPNAKLQKKSSSRVIRPEWIVESVSAGKLLPIHPYLLCARPALQPSINNVIDQGKRVKTATDTGFIAEFYNNSRLHHLSTMGALLKQYVCELKEKHTGNFPGLQRLVKEKTEDYTALPDRIIMHIDMDSFFVSVALRERPDLIGKPVAVTHARGNNAVAREGADPDVERALYEKRWAEKVGAVKNGSSVFSKKAGPSSGSRDSRSEVASCSYEARAKGVKNGMYLGRALSLCPDLITVPYDFQSYTEVSYGLYDTVAEYTLNVEAVSCDELFVDCTSLLKSTRVDPLLFAKRLRSDVKALTKCPCSAGLGSNKLQARLASRKAKPDGQFYLTSEELTSFINQVKVSDLPGVGWSTCNKLQELNVETCFDLQLLPLATLKKHLGDKTGETLYRFCRGQDDRPLVLEHQRKSVSAEVNYGIRFSSAEEAEDFFRRLSNEVSERLKNLRVLGRLITLKILSRSAEAPAESAKFLGHGVCDSSSKSTLLKKCTDQEDDIFKAVLEMYTKMEIPPEELRGIGIQVTKLEGAEKSGTLQSFLGRKKTQKTTLSNEPTTPQPQASSSCKQLLPSLSALDEDVLNALPEDIRKEILQECQGLQFPKQIVSDIKNLPSGSTVQTLEQSSKQSSDEEASDPLEDLDVDELRQMVRKWIKEPEPEAYDIDILSLHLARLVKKKRIEDVELIVRTLFLCISNSNLDSWINAYQQITDHVQAAMIVVYKNPMSIPNFKPL